MNDLVGLGASVVLLVGVVGFFVYIAYLRVRFEYDEYRRRCMRAIQPALERGYVVHGRVDGGRMSISVVLGNGNVLAFEGDGSAEWLASVRDELEELPRAAGAYEVHR